MKDDAVLQGHSHRPHSAADKAVIEEVFGELIDKGILVKIYDAQFSSPIHVERQPNRDPRPVIDFRRLNTNVKFFERPDQGCAQRIRALLPRCKVVSTFDLTKGYYQLPMDPSCQHYFAIRCHMGTFQPTRLLMGDSNAVGYFHNVIGVVFKDVNIQGR